MASPCGIASHVFNEKRSVLVAVFILLVPILSTSVSWGGGLSSVQRWGLQAGVPGLRLSPALQSLATPTRATPTTPRPGQPTQATPTTAEPGHAHPVCSLALHRKTLADCCI